MTSLECPISCFVTVGGSETEHTVRDPSAAPYASKLELMCPNFNTVTVNKINKQELLLPL